MPTRHVARSPMPTCSNCYTRCRPPRCVFPEAVSAAPASVSARCRACRDSASRAKARAAPHHMLCELDYLSTVSGGGYIGSWLMAWTKRLTDQAPGADAGEQGVASQAQKRAGADD